MQVDINKSKVTIREGDDSITSDDIRRAAGNGTKKVERGKLYATAISEGNAYFVKSALSKVIYAPRGEALAEDYLKGVDAVLTVAGPLAVQAEGAGIQVVKIALDLEDADWELLKMLDAAEVGRLHDEIHEISDQLDKHEEK